MTKHLITPSLLNSLHWYLKESFAKTEAEQRQEFLQTLRREKTEPNEAMRLGIEFEEAVLDASKSNFDLRNFEDSIDEDSVFCENKAYDLCVASLSRIVQGGFWQQSVKKDLTVGNHEFLLYGRTDVIKRDTVFDIKFTSNYELGKFQDSSQHLIYLYCSDLPKFSYLISDGKDWWREDYFNHAGVEGEIKSKVSEFLDYLEQDKEAKELYLKEVCAENALTE